MKAVIDLIQVIVGFVTFILLVACAGSLEFDWITESEFIVRGVIYLAVLGADILIFKLRYPEEF